MTVIPDPENMTINAPLIMKMRDIIFFAGKLHNGPFQGMFRGGQDFFDPKIVPSAVTGMTMLADGRTGLGPIYNEWAMSVGFF
jgi:hypothetical protein